MAVILSGAARKQYVDVLAQWSQSQFPEDPVTWEGRAERDRLDFLPEMLPKAIKCELYEYARQGGVIKRVDETNPDYSHWKYNFKLWPTINGRVYFFETRFDLNDPEQPIIRIMRFKPNDRKF